MLSRVIRGFPVEIVKTKGGLALVFVCDEYAGTVERDDVLGTWGAYTLFRTGEPTTTEGMWGAIDALVIEHVESAMKEVFAR
jgi:hypothetical protein